MAFKDIVKAAKAFIGLPLVYLGVLALAIGRLAGWNNNNVLDLSAVVSVAAGIVFYVIRKKHESNY